MRGGEICDQPNTASNRRSLWHDRSGVTAIEFAMVALPFFALVFGIIEVGLAHFANRMVDNAVVSAARLIRTGQAEKGKISADSFKQQICDSMPSFMCDTDKIYVDVTSVDSFAKAQSTDSLYDEDGKLKEELSYNIGGSGDIVVVNVIYKWPMVAANLYLDYADHGNERHLTSTMVFRNEPWE
ncbi:TadE/TadG family type IV pilus assembly protein [Roseibium salinum]|uniref:Pilus assembly protein n=1 Tax=Roseibium salinum TaxID=1604349 RepID=A0ABT3R4E7_9HYPH|nr:TadE/TadG family type IV pilus assembly protein [Roseibium sp. DSM 29163]MCX2724146.1 pilus assembly protein [Roseibium sp. DSM 29163]